uniref:Uncharacterized protein n=1 Tax=Plectus sambesii TaxID=2011161 RepID=A0A914UKC6_9BILA
MFSQLFLIFLLPMALGEFSLSKYEGFEEDLMKLIKREECERERSVTKDEAACELVKLVCLLNETDQAPIPFFRRRNMNPTILPTDEKRSDLYIALRNIDAYFKVSMCADERIKRTLLSEKLRALTELQRSKRHLALAEDLSMSVEEKSQFKMVEERKKLNEANERAQSVHQELNDALRSLQDDCVKTHLGANCRWLGNYKRRVQMAEIFKNVTESALYINSIKKVIDEPYDTQKVRECIERWTRILEDIEADLDKLEPKRSLLKSINRAIGVLLRREDAWIFSKSPNVAKNSLKDLLNHAQTYYSVYVTKTEMDSQDPAHRISHLNQDQISLLAQSFNRFLHDLDFTSMLDYDD